MQHPIVGFIKNKNKSEDFSLGVFEANLNQNTKLF